jgi:uncharacterized protein YxjI
MSPSHTPATVSKPPPSVSPDTVASTQTSSRSDGDALASALQRDKFLLRQKRVSINEKYSVLDEHGREFLYVERPKHLLRNLGAALVGVVAGVLTGLLLGVTAAAVPNGSLLQVFLVVAAVLGGLAVCVVVALALAKKRHVGFYADKVKSTRVLEVLQDKKAHFVNETYTLTDADGHVLSRFRKNHLYNFVRKRWYCDDANGEPLLVAKEDSIVRSILRRVLPEPLGWALRTNFVMLDARNNKLGEFNRKFTLFDRYVLDMTADSSRAIDRRIALALGVMLDTGERR